MQEKIEALKLVAQTFAKYADNPVSSEGHKLLKLLKDTDLVYKFFRTINSIEDEVSNPSLSRIEKEQAEKYQKIISIVMSDCQPRG